MRSTIIVITRSSGTRAPRSMYSLALVPSSVPLLRCARSRSPLAMWGMPYFEAMRRAWVPLPAPTGPSRMRSSGLTPNEAPVIAHDELRFELPHRIEGDADHDQHSRTGDCQCLEAGGALHDVRQDGDDS